MTFRRLTLEVFKIYWYIFRKFTYLSVICEATNARLRSISCPLSASLLNSALPMLFPVMAYESFVEIRQIFIFPEFISPHLTLYYPSKYVFIYFIVKMTFLSA